MNQLDYYRIEKAINYLEKNFKDQPSLDEIASHIGLSPFHFQKLFKRWAGISPKKFLQFLTIEYTKNKIQNSPSLLDATYDAGLSSTSRLHEYFVNIEAVTPKEFKTKGKDMLIYYGFHETQFGMCLIGITDLGICALYFVQNENIDETLLDLKTRWDNAKFVEEKTKTGKVVKEIFSANDKKINIFLKGTNFQIQVWKALLSIPEGHLTTYEEIAKKVGSPKAVRAVGTAVSNNPISFLIPCHRVINKMGLIGNYRWGRSRKKAMLVWESSKTN